MLSKVRIDPDGYKPRSVYDRIIPKKSEITLLARAYKQNPNIRKEGYYIHPRENGNPVIFQVYVMEPSYESIMFETVDPIQSIENNQRVTTIGPARFEISHTSPPNGIGRSEVLAVSMVIDPTAHNGTIHGSGGSIVLPTFAKRH